MTSSDPIDALITWVDGTCPSHRETRARYQAMQSAPLSENASNPHRWESGDEIYFCLKSLQKYAPWLRRIWILVDGAAPKLEGLPEALVQKIRIAQHHETFPDPSTHLPTFNSLAIETVMWRIEGLADRFLYFNDDVFLTNAVSPSDFFHGDQVCLRGRWMDMRPFSTPAARMDPAAFNHVVHLNAAKLSNHPTDHVFYAAHSVHPMRRSVHAAIAEEFPENLRANAGFRFRDISQVSPTALHNLHLFKSGQARLLEAPDHVHFYSGIGAQNDEDTLAKRLRALRSPRTKIICVNDMPQLETLRPDFRALLNSALFGIA